MTEKTDRAFVRDSNIELARIVAMLLILALHAFNNYFWNNLSSQVTAQNVIAILGEAFTSCAVGLFVFISGWYGIKRKVKSIVNIAFQVIFYGIIICLVVSIIKGSFQWKGLKETLLLSDSLWFIKSYFLLYILSPVLNSFVEKADKRQFQSVLIAFFLFQSIWGWLNFAEEFNYGLSVVFFIFIYLLARYIRLYAHKITEFSKFVYLGVYCLSAILVSLLLFVKHYYGIIPLTEHMLMSYVCPFMVLSSVSLFLFFTKLHIKSKAINWISASCLSVYLIHANALVAPYYRAMAGNVYLDGHYIMFVAIIVGVFICCVGVDQVRRLLYKLTIGNSNGINSSSGL